MRAAAVNSRVREGVCEGERTVEVPSAALVGGLGVAGGGKNCAWGWVGGVEEWKRGGGCAQWCWGVWWV